MFEEIFTLMQEAEVEALKHDMNEAQTLIDACMDDLKRNACDPSIAVVTSRVASPSQKVVALAHDLMSKDADPERVQLSCVEYGKHSKKFSFVVAVIRKSVVKA